MTGVGRCAPACFHMPPISRCFFLICLALTPAFSAETVSEGAASLASAITDAPSLQATRARVDAARERLGAAARFPDPEVEGMISRKNTAMESMPMWEISIRQPLPKKGERAADRERALAVVAMAEAEFFSMAGEMAADVTLALGEAETAQQRARILSAQIARTGQVLSVIDARIATGQGRLADRLALQSNIAGMQLMLARDEQMAADSLSEARARLGFSSEATLPAFTAPEVGDIQPELTPALALAQARSAEAQAMTRMARAEARPMTAVGLRFEREQERMGDNDTVGVAFMTELPWRGRRYARAEERAARAEASAATADAAAARHRITAALSQVERAGRLVELARRLAQETQARLDADFESLVRAAGTGGTGGESTVLMILEVLEKSTEARLQVVDAEGTVRAARAALWRHAPARFFSRP
jgi:outer membrane protein, heavy metal efflux system